jgi:hypothetical protein
MGHGRMEYDDDYPTCKMTYATLLVYSGGHDPAIVTDVLGLTPSRVVREGELLSTPPCPPRCAKINLWELTSKERLHSLDSRRHVDWLLEQCTGKLEEVRRLQAGGCIFTINCYWLSRYGQGGPAISPAQMRTMGSMDIELWFDVY